MFLPKTAIRTIPIESLQEKGRNPMEISESFKLVLAYFPHVEHIDIF